MKDFISLLLALCVGLSYTLHSAEPPTSTEPAKAQIAKTPEEKAKAEEQAKTYPLKTCLVSGDNLGGMGETIDCLYQGKLIRFCCKGCIKSFNKNPDKYLQELGTAKKPAA
ncbi:MAG: hypothetical protein EB090_05510 [Verrucomicrobia bacterium]|nr:hypothetical protein [Verrucomicrobiota bacterium]